MLKYFLPNWEDRLDPNFDFVNDAYSEKHNKNPYENDIYAHQLFEITPYEGILFSLSLFKSKLKLKNEAGNGYGIRNRTNIKDYLKISRDSSLEVMGDCGAFSYINEKEPPLPFYSVDNISQIYEKLGFDYGVSVDHMVVDYFFVKDKLSGRRKKQFLPKEEQDMRIEITLRNARNFLKLHNKNDYTFTPIGVAQGYDLDSYKYSVCALLEIGYEYIGIGGLVQYKSEFILNILKECQPLTKDIKLHLFGVLRPKYLEDFKRLGVTSFDSASFFRKAWLKSRQNYLSQNGKWYSAIRVPQSSNPRLLKNANLNGFSIDDLRKMENDVLQALIKYDEGEINLKNVLDLVLKYDVLLLRITDDGKNLIERYKLTLMDKPWKSCDCDICKKLGIQVIIFRGTNRNKRRGFHNIWVYRKIENHF